MQNTKKPGLFRRVWRWILYCLITLLIILMIPVAYVAWKTLGVMSELTSFQPLHMLAAQYTPKDVIGDLGGMKVLIPKGCVENVEYNGDPGWGEKRKGPIPERNYDSKLTSFGIDFRFPDMRCKDSQEMREDYRNQFLKRNNPWVHIGINVGEIYPKLGANATNALARPVIDSIDAPTQFWLSNYERLPESPYGLEAYVVTGLHPKTGIPLRKTEASIFIHKADSGLVDTYIRCRKAHSGGESGCDMSFSMEPRARVYLRVVFSAGRRSQWREIRQAAIDLLTSYEIHEADSARLFAPDSLAK